MSHITGDGGSFSSGNTGAAGACAGGGCGGGAEEVQQQQKLLNHLNSLASSIITTTTNNNNNSSGSITQQQQPPPVKKKRNLPGNPDPSAEVIALSPGTLLATNRFVCEICNKGFQRDQNLQLHRRGHNLPWKLKQRSGTEIRKRVYVCPEPSCVHHNPARALGDLTGIKKHFCRKHGEKKWKCEKCTKKYAVKSDWKAHMRTCGSKEYKCDCGTVFSRRDSFITHRAFCDALAEENNKTSQGLMPNNLEPNLPGQISNLISSIPINNNPNQSTIISDFNHLDTKNPLPLRHELMPVQPKPSGLMLSGSATGFFGCARSMSNISSPSLQVNANSPAIFEGNGHHLVGSASMSATALLQKAAQMGATASCSVNSSMMQKSFATSVAPPTFGEMQIQNDQSELAGGDCGYVNQFFSSNGGVENSVSNSVGMFSGVLDQNSSLLLKNMGNGSSNNKNRFHGARSSPAVSSTPTTGVNHSSGLSRFDGDVMTVDFLGIEGPRTRNFHEQQNHQEMVELRGIDHPRMQGFSDFEQQVAMEKSIWDL